MVGLALQLGLTLDNYRIAHDAHRRTQEYELLTQTSAKPSARASIRTKCCAPSTLSWDRFLTPALSTSPSRKAMKFVLNWKSRTIKFCPSVLCKFENAFTEYVMRTGQPLLICSDLEKTRTRLGHHLSTGKSGQMPLRSTHPLG